MAYAALLRGAARSVALYDINAAKVEAEALDLGHGIQFMPMAEVVGSDDIAVCADADVVMFTAGAKQKPGQSRLDLAEATIGLVRKVLPALVEVAPDAVYVMVTNPVDVVTYAALKISGLPPSQLFGSGTVLDSSRLRYLIAQHTRGRGAERARVHRRRARRHRAPAVGVGEHRRRCRCSSGRGRGGRGPLTAEVRERIAHEVVDSAYRIIEGKGATNYAVALAGSRIIEAILKDERRVLPVSSLLDDFHGISDVCLSVPAIVGAHGVGERLPVPLSDDELAGLRASADARRGRWPRQLRRSERRTPRRMRRTRGRTSQRVRPDATRVRGCAGR